MIYLRCVKSLSKQESRGLSNSDAASEGSTQRRISSKLAIWEHLEAANHNNTSWNSLSSGLLGNRASARLGSSSTARTPPWWRRPLWHHKSCSLGIKLGKSSNYEATAHAGWTGCEPWHSQSLLSAARLWGRSLTCSSHTPTISW